MQRDIITVSPETRILDIHRLFVEEEIHGAPVVDEDGIVYGILSSMDLLRIVRDADDAEQRMQELTAADAMTPEVIMVSPDATTEEVARTMVDHHIHRVLVGEHRMLEGVITSFDLMKVLAGGESPSAGLTRHTGYSR